MTQNFYKQLRFALGLLALCVGSTLLVGCDNDKSAPRVPLLFEGDQILAFGDSLTYGTGAGQQSSYPAVLSALTQVPVINAGVPGETTTQGLQRLPAVLAKHQPALVLLCLGGNDFLRKLPAEQTYDNLSRMLTLIKDSGSAVVLIGVPRPGFSLADDPLYERLAQTHNVPLAKAVIAQVLDKKTLKSDPIHPNGEGYRQIAAELQHFLKSRGAL